MRHILLFEPGQTQAEHDEEILRESLISDVHSAAYARLNDFSALLGVLEDVDVDFHDRVIDLPSDAYQMICMFAEKADIDGLEMMLDALRDSSANELIEGKA